MNKSKEDMKPYTIAQWIFHPETGEITFETNKEISIEDIKNFRNDLDIIIQDNEETKKKITQEKINSISKQITELCNLNKEIVNNLIKVIETNNEK